MEDTVSVAFEFMLRETADPTKLSKGILQRVAKLLKDDKNDLKVWELADNGWRNTLINYKQQMLHAHIGFFNTPKAGNVDTLFKAALDLPDLSKEWFWQNMSPENAKDRLCEFIDLRGSIAHRVNASRAVHKKDVRDYRRLLKRLSVRTANVTRKHIHSLVAKYPWTSYRMGNFR